MRSGESKVKFQRRGWPQRVGWGLLTLLLLTFAVFESAKYGWPTTIAALAFFALPDLAGLAGIRPPGLPYQAVNRVWLPLMVLVGYSVAPFAWPPLFTAALAWLTRIALDRTSGHGLHARNTAETAA